MRLLVTGGAGFIGSHIVEAAIEAGYDVRVLDALLPAVHPAGAAVIPTGAEFIRGDVSDLTVISGALDGVDVVCHQAAMVGLGVDFGDTPDYVRHNDLATASLLAAMTSKGISQLVLASSMVVYGEGAYSSPGIGPVRPAARAIADLDARRFEPYCPHSGAALRPELVTEDVELDPRNVYAATKVAQEHLSRAWARTAGGRVAALRYHNVYGPRMPKNTPYAGVAAMFRSALARGEAPEVFEDGHQRRDFVHVTDVASANIAALRWAKEPEAGNWRAFNVGSGHIHTIGDVAQALSEASSGPEPVMSGRYRLGDVRHITASSERLRAELGWVPAVDFERGMREFALAPQRGD